jgi:PAS domain S-box-containing protein
MKDTNKTKDQLINELVKLRQQVAELKTEHTGDLNERIKVDSRLEYLLAEGPAVIYCSKPSGDYRATFISKNIKDQTGYAPHEFTDDPGFWAEHIHPEDVARVLNDLKDLHEEGHHAHEYRFRHKDGTYRWMYDELKLSYDADGNPMEVVGYWIDITERKRAEDALKDERERLHTIMDSFPGFVYLQAPDYTIRFASKRFKDEYGEPGNRPCYEVIWGRKEPCEDCPTFSVFDTKKPVRWISDHVSKGRVYDVYDYPYINTDGTFLVLEISMDITDRRAAEEQLHQKSGELKVLTEDLRKLSSLMSKEEELFRRRLARTLHEQIGQNLAVFSMKCDDITEGILTGENKIKDTISNLKPLLEDTISSTRELTSDLYPTILDDLGFLPAVTWYKDLVLEPLKIAVLMDIDKSVEDLPSDYKLPLFRITQEAFQNISKHASATEVEVKFSTHGRSMKLYIKDNGVGFDLKEMKAKKDKGIGLILLKERSISLGGSLTIESALGKGTELTIELPINKQ